MKKKGGQYVEDALLSRISEGGQCKKEGCTKPCMWRFVETAGGGLKKRLTDFCEYCSNKIDEKPHSLRDEIRVVWTEIVNEVKNEIEQEIKKHDPYKRKR